MSCHTPVERGNRTLETPAIGGDHPTEGGKWISDLYN